MSNSIFTEFFSHFGPSPGRQEARVVSLMVLAVAVILGGLEFQHGLEGRRLLGRPLGGDFAQFYVAGKIVNDYGVSRVYDLELATRLQHEIVPAADESQMLVYAGAPFLAVLYQPLALLPYIWSYCLWLILSAALYAGALWLLWPPGLCGQEKTTGMMLAFSWVPFLFGTWIYGQVAVWGLIALGAFVYFRRRNQLILAGLFFSLTLLKPTMFALPAVMFVIGGQWPVLIGIAAGATVLSVFSLAIARTSGLIGWFDTLMYYRELVTGPVEILQRHKYVDINSFFHLVAGGGGRLTDGLSVLFEGAGFLVLAVAWWRSRGWPQVAQDRLLAATIIGTLVINAYVPIYDTVLAIAAVLLVVGQVGPRLELNETFMAWITLLYVVPWFTELSAEHLNFQLYTLVLAGFGFWLVLTAREMGGQSQLAETPSNRRPHMGVRCRREPESMPEGYA